MDKVELIFNMYKDDVIEIEKFRPMINKKYKLSDIEISNIYAKINNYQIKKYGIKQDKSNIIEIDTKEEWDKVRRNIQSNKKRRLNNYK